MSCPSSLQESFESNLDSLKLEDVSDLSQSNHMNGDDNEEEEIEDSSSIKSTSIDLDFTDTDDSASELEYDGNLTPFNSLQSTSVVEEEAPKITDQVADQVIALFKVKRPVRFIDKESKEDEISYEESEVRLIILMIVTAIILILASTSLAAFTFLSMFNKEVLKNPWDTTIPNSAKVSFPTFNVIVIGLNGNLESLQLQNQSSLKKSYKMKLPKSESREWAWMVLEGYFVFAEQGDVYVIKSKGVKTDKGKKLVTKISSNGHHRVIKGTELPERFTSVDTTSFRLGNSFWIVGQPDLYKLGTFVLEHRVESWIFSIDKQRWFKGPFSFDDSVQWRDSCGVPLNRTFGLILHRTLEPAHCIGYHLFNFGERFTFTNNSCFLDILYNVQHVTTTSCTSMVEKNGLR